ncbi:hypothetical protein D3C71_1529000 [compost metagenome]
MLAKLVFTKFTRVLNKAVVAQTALPVLQLNLQCPKHVSKLLIRQRRVQQQVDVKSFAFQRTLYAQLDAGKNLLRTQRIGICLQVLSDGQEAVESPVVHQHVDVGVRVVHRLDGLLDDGLSLGIVFGAAKPEATPLVGRWCMGMKIPKAPQGATIGSVHSLLPNFVDIDTTRDK